MSSPELSLHSQNPGTPVWPELQAYKGDLFSTVCFQYRTSNSQIRSELARNPYRARIAYPDQDHIRSTNRLRRERRCDPRDRILAEEVCSCHISPVSETMSWGTPQRTPRIYAIVVPVPKRNISPARLSSCYQDTK